MDLQKIDRSKMLNSNIACAELRCYRCIIVVGPTHCYSTNPNPNHSQSCSERSKGSRKLHRLAAQLNFHLCVGRPVQHMPMTAAATLSCFLDPAAESFADAVCKRWSSSGVRTNKNEAAWLQVPVNQEAQQLLLGWPHQRENAVSDRGGLTRPWLWRSSNPNLVMKFSTNKLEWMGYIPAKFRDSSSRISWFAHRRFLPPAHPPGSNHCAIYPLMRPKMKPLYR